MGFPFASLVVAYDPSRDNVLRFYHADNYLEIHDHHGHSLVEVTYRDHMSANLR